MMKMITMVMMSMVKVMMIMLKMRMMKMGGDKGLDAMKLWLLIQTHCPCGSCSQKCPLFPVVLRDFIKEAQMNYSASIIHAVTKGIMSMMVATS